jgi:hypothetical protein
MMGRNCSEVKLTGEIKYRSGWFGKVILQVEIVVESQDEYSLATHEYNDWRDARIEDMSFIIKFNNNM